MEHGRESLSFICGGNRERVEERHEIGMVKSHLNVHMHMDTDATEEREGFDTGYGAAMEKVARKLPGFFIFIFSSSSFHSQYTLEQVFPPFACFSPFHSHSTHSNRSFPAFSFIQITGEPHQHTHTNGQVSFFFLLFPIHRKPFSKKTPPQKNKPTHTHEMFGSL